MPGAPAGANLMSAPNYYTFTGTAGQLMSFQAMSASITAINSPSYKTGPDSVDTVLTIYGPDGQVIASNDDQFEPSDSSIFDLTLPALGTYTVEVSAFHSSDPSFNDPSSSNFNQAAFFNTEHGAYELFMYTFSAYNANTGNDTIEPTGTIVATPQIVAVAHNSPGTAITLAGTDDGGPVLTQTFAFSQPLHGTVIVVGVTGSPEVIYTPDAGFNGTDSFTFTADNGIPATVTLDVGAGIPTAIAQSANVPHDSSGTAITLTGSDDDNPPLAQNFTFTQPAHGTVTVVGVAGSPQVIYTPNAGFYGADSFTFTDDNGINTSAPATVMLNVSIGTPTANPQNVSTSQNTPVNITLTGSDDDSPALGLTYAIVGGDGPLNGTITNFNPATGTLTYTPNLNSTAPGSFDFTVSNGTNVSALAAVSITVIPTKATVSSTVGVAWGTAGTATLLTKTDGLRLLPSARNTDMPWLGINRLSITLSAPETLVSGDVSVTGINVASYGPVTISGSGTNYTITLAQPINGADRVTVTIGNAGITTFTRRLDVLPGDVNDDGVVNSQDPIIVRNQYLGLGTVSVPPAFLDINGDGVIDVNDYNLVRQRSGLRLP